MKMFTTEFAWPRRPYFPDIAGEVFGDFDQIAETFLRPPLAGNRDFQPSCDVHEMKNHFLVTFDMPGVKKEDIKIDVQGSKLVISGERRRELGRTDEQSNMRSERGYGKFERIFSLPSTVDTEKIEAQYEDGVLNVAIPKSETAKARTVQIQDGRPGFLSQLLGISKERPKEMKDVKVS